jgi:anthranilate synthase/aminodeoxychorismate synthase-like glutamine amidotransferase
MHGKTSRIHHSGAGIFRGLPNPFTATRYHSLVIDPASLPPSLEVTATSEDGEIMAVQHVEHPVYGVQFHPESVLTEHGYRLLDHFLHGIPEHPRTLPGAADGAALPLSSDESTLASEPPPVDLVR